MIELRRRVPVPQGQNPNPTERDYLSATVTHHKDGTMSVRLPYRTLQNLIVDAHYYNLLMRNRFDDMGDDDTAEFCQMLADAQSRLSDKVER